MTRSCKLWALRLVSIPAIFYLPIACAGIGISVSHENKIRHHVPLILALAVLLESCQRLTVQHKALTETADERSVRVLNQLRNNLNAQYGYREGVPRINLGPCGRFAKAFRERWNIRFPEKINIAFVMANDGSQCRHVVVRLPDGNYYDGGNGVLSNRTLLGLFPESRMDEMTEFDLKLLDERSYGLLRDYPVCPNYSDDTTAMLIERCLAQLPQY